MKYEIPGITEINNLIPPMIFTQHLVPAVNKRVKVRYTPRPVPFTFDANNPEFTVTAEVLFEVCTVLNGTNVQFLDYSFYDKGPSTGFPVSNAKRPEVIDISGEEYWVMFYNTYHGKSWAEAFKKASDNVYPRLNMAFATFRKWEVAQSKSKEFCIGIDDIESIVLGASNKFMLGETRNEKVGTLA